MEPQAQPPPPTSDEWVPVAPEASAAPPPESDQWVPVAQNPAAIEPGSPQATDATHAYNGGFHPLEHTLYPDVDFDRGVGFLDKTHLAQASNFDEKLLYLTKVYGDKNVSTRDGPFGPIIVVKDKDGSSFAAEGGKPFDHFIADTIGAGPEFLGAAIGGTFGSVAGPPGAAAGAGLGGGIGHEFIQLGKQFNGIYRQSSPEAIEDAVKSVALNSAGEGAGNLVTGAVSKGLRGGLPNIIKGQTGDDAAMTERFLAGGARPPSQTTMPGAKHLQFIETRGAKLTGPVKAQDAANEAYIRNRIRTIMGDSGMTDEQADNMLAELSKGDSTIPTAKIGEEVQKRVQAHQDMLTQSVTTQTEALEKQANESLTHLEALTRAHPPGALGVDVAGGIQQARADFGTAMSKAYGQIDHMVGDEPLVPVEIVRKEAQKIVRLRPKTASSPIKQAGALPGAAAEAPEDAADIALLKEFGIELPADPNGKISFADAQHFRTVLREAAHGDNLTRGVSAGQAQHMADMFDYAIQSAGSDPKAASAVRLLNQVDGVYAKGIKRFNDTGVVKLLRDMKAGIPPDPEVTAATIIRPGYEGRAAEIRKMVGPDVWNKVASADYRQLIDGATNDEGQVEGASLLHQINKRGEKLMNTVYGDKQAANLRAAAEALARHDGKLSTDAMTPGRIQDTARRLDYDQARLDKFMKESAIATLANPRANPEQVYAYLVKPENGHALQEAVTTFGADSPQIKGIQQGALQELLAQAKYRAASDTPADALSKALSQYSPEQQKILFPNGMDTDLHLVGREIQGLMKDLQDDSMAGMSAGQIQGRSFWRRVPSQVYNGMYQTLLSQPGVIRYLALGLHPLPAAPGKGASMAAQAMWSARVELRQNTKEALRDLVRYGTISPTVNSNKGYKSGQGDATQPGADNSPPTLSADAGG